MENMTPKIEDLVVALREQYPYVKRDVEAITLGDKLREEMFGLLKKDLHKKGKVVGRSLDGQSDIYEQELTVTTDEIEILQKKLTLLESSLKLTGMLRELVEKLPPAAEGEAEYQEAGGALKKFRERNKLNNDEPTGNTIGI